jgi:hypothetical protein
MDVWQLGLYAVASLLALRSLASLMTSHKHQYHEQMMAAEFARQKAARKKARQEAEAAKRAGEAAA